MCFEVKGSNAPNLNSYVAVEVKQGANVVATEKSEDVV